VVDSFPSVGMINGVGIFSPSRLCNAYDRIDFNLYAVGVPGIFSTANFFVLSNWITALTSSISMSEVCEDDNQKENVS